MTKALEIHHLADTSQVRLAMRDENGERAAPPATFRNPLDDGDSREIDWYLREYLDRPFGRARERAAAVETGLRNLGRLLFEVVFGGSQEARDLYASATVDGLENYRLVVISRVSEFLALPWELLNEPEGGYLASRVAGVVRRTSPEPLSAFAAPLPTDQLNVLLVSPPASGHSTSLFWSMASETVKVLESLPVQVELDYLSPPNLEELHGALARRTGHYHLVHLDGVAPGTGSDTLALESAGTEIEPAPVGRVARLLSEAGVPVVLMNAGDGGDQNGTAGWSQASAGLINGGVPLAVTLPYPLHDSATREKFLRSFYDSLIKGGDIASCVSRSRRALMDSPHRTTLLGQQVFWDWIVPSVYQSQEYSAPAIEAEQPNPLSPPVVQPQGESAPEPQLPAPGQFGLVGRQRELRHLERLLREHRIVLVAGNTGVGKTELALGVARWAQSLGRKSKPGGVFYTSFETSHPAGLERVVHEIGTSIAGLEFADLPAGQQYQWVVDYLQNNPSLIVWDNLENVAGFPTGSPGLLEPEGQSRLASFLLEATRHDSTRALLVGRRREEPWVATSHATEELSGLRGHDRVELAGLIMEKAGVDPGRVGPEIIDLLELIEGHPLAMQMALPLLKEVPASVLLGELTRALAELPAASAEEGRDPFLTAVMEYAWGKMSHRNRTHLPFLALFQRRVMMDILNHITQEQVYRSVMGEQLGWGACRTLLRSAQTAGFLEPVSPSVYQIHPALPWFLGRKLSQQVRGPGIAQLEQEFVRVYSDTADYFMESLYENQDSGVTAVLAEEGNLTQALGLALESQQWDSAQLLVQPLAQVYRMQKRYPELRRLRRQLLEAAGETAEEASSRGSIELWQYLLGTEASDSVEVGDLDHAEDLNRQLLEYLTAQPDGNSDPRTAAVYHQMGQVALKRWRLDEAAGWFQKSLAIIENSDDRASVADNYFALGQVKQYQRYYTEAKEWYKKALDIHQRLPDEEEMVKDYRALGLASQLKFEYQEAENWYHRARELVEEHRDEETAILIYHELGTVSHAQYLFDSATSWYQQALSLADRLGKQEQVAVEFHHLGLLTQARGIIYDEAEEWYLAALEQWEKLGNRKAIGEECRQLGVLFHEQKRFDDAQKWYHQAREVFEEVGDPQRIARTYGQLGMVAEEQGNLSDALEWVARTYHLAEEYDLPVMVQVKAHMARLRDECGPEDFTRRWQDFTGQEPPTDLEVDTSGIL